jgi:two-component system sensor histidine kinase BaeS
MRSLTAKLTLAFLLVGLLGAVLVAVLVRQHTQNEFGQFILDQNQQALVTNLTSYYEIHGTWVGVEAIFRPGYGFNSEFEPSLNRWDSRRVLFTLVNAQGMVVLGSGPRDHGEQLSSAELRRGIPLEVDGESIGWLLFIPGLDRMEPGTPEGEFLLSVNRAIFLSALAATGIALLLGGFLAYTLTRSLRELTAATRELARGKLGHQVPVHSRDELGQLAASFNAMSTELAHSNELRRQMTADIAHDLRTPLSVILGYTEALSDQKLDPTPEMYAVMHTEAQHLSRLIDDLKTLSLADAGELSLIFQPIPPGDLLRRAADAQRVRAQEAQIDLEVQIQSALPPVRVDVERMAQVLGNLVDNAMRYTPAGGRIVLSAEKVNEEVLMHVSDTGVGIAREDLPNIFERSFRGDKARQQKGGETGLGLAIAKSLVEAQGGQISVQSTPGQGTRFTIQM